MTDDAFNLPAWLERIGYTGPLEPTLATLAAVVTASSQAIPYENIDVLLGHPPKLDIASLQDKMVANGRGGFCFEQTLLLRAALRAMGFAAAGLLARVILGLPADSERIAAHGAVRVDSARRSVPR
jgi:N-hydroxyarylamine O-acetyltransferase